ncbi:MAG: choice-of-anchor Q domain-containing protein [Planctomycetota bacterium]
MRLPKHALRLEQLEDRRLLTITVDTLVDELDGSIVDGDISLRDAIAAAATGETIDFAVNGTILLDPALGELLIDKDLTIDGPGPDQLTIDAQGNSRVLSIQETNVADIREVTLTRGAADYGGAIANFGIASITASTLSGNIAIGPASECYLGDVGLGGAIYNRGRLLVNDSLISGNSADCYGGGLLNRGEATFSYAELVENSSGIENRGGDLGIASSTISSNVGAGIYNYGDNMTLSVTTSTISHNGSGVINIGYNSSSIRSSTISGNGEGLTNRGGDAFIAHSTITDNNLGVISSAWNFDYGSNSITESVVSGNLIREISLCAADVFFKGVNLVGDSSKTTNEALYVYDDKYGYCFSTVGLSGSEIVATSDGGTPTPLEEILDTALADNGGSTLTHALVKGSPAIDAGDPTAMAGVGDTSLYDQRGLPFTRVFDGDAIPGARIDIGAFEMQPPLVSCDFDGDEICDIADIDALVGAIAAGTNDPLYDLTGDDRVDLVDRDAWLVEAGAMNLASGNAYLLGDANLDGVVDGQDFIIWNQHRFTATAAWSQADFNADGQTDGQDFVIWNMFKFQESDEEEAGSARTEGVLLFSS